MSNEKTYQLYVGYLGYHGASTDPIIHQKSIIANMLVDEYNKNVSTYKTKREQMSYQHYMMEQINKRLNT